MLGKSKLKVCKMISVVQIYFQWCKAHFSGISLCKAVKPPI